MQQISEHVYMLGMLGGYLNIYVIVNGDTLTVVDAGMNAGNIDQLERGLAAHGWNMEQVQHILITHCHFDHVGGLANLQSRCDARTYAHRLDAQVIRGERSVTYADPADLGWFSRLMVPFLASGNASTPARVDVDLHDEQVLDTVLPGLIVVHLPGHTYGQCGFWLPDEGVLIGGDVAMNPPFGLSYPFRAASPDWDAVKTSLQRVADLAPSVLCVGHGHPVRDDVASQIKRLLGA